ncbi:MAG: hypothetical protein IJL34_00235 [Treponema sp.]|nr:hypothetical protein [Treponema sp.]
MINTYNETSLHAVLKKMYAVEDDSLTEQKYGPFILDIQTRNGDAIEIQTANISSLTKKSEYMLQNKKKIKIVHPVAVNKTIKTLRADGELISERKSSAHPTVYSALRSMTGMYPYFLRKGFSLEVLYVEELEIRRKTEEKVQTHNKSRRHLKDWIIINKELVQIYEKKVFKTKSDWINLLPVECRREFTKPLLQKTLKEQLIKEGHSKTSAAKNSSYCPLLVWLLLKMELIEEIGMSGRAKLYKVI